MEWVERLLEQIRSVLESQEDRVARARRAAEWVRHGRGYRWVGIYELDGEEIAVIAWSGPSAPAYPRFPADQGLCGAAVRSGAAVVADDVSTDPRYLTTFSSTRSEIVVPIRSSGTGAIVGVVDVESERLNAFGAEDCAFLEQCASTLARLWAEPSSGL